MLKRYGGLLLFAAGLLAASGVMYAVLYVFFENVHDIVFYSILELAFLPIQVVLVGIVIEGLLARRQRRERLHKMNMVIGVFFTEMGTRLLGDLARSLANRGEVAGALGVRADWKDEDFRRALTYASQTPWQVDPARLDLAALRDALAANRDLIVLLLANPNLLEHERFTDLLWSVSHLAEELSARPSLEGLPQADRDHLVGDVKRVCGHLTAEWLRYCRHLQHAYPFIFSVIVRTHPLQDNPSATVK
ncbi:MAG: hypothetical protein NT049_14415 [Planctomycetota bacterium]|nr:hypothetical protein [Planctomycetota bacterium]